MDKDLACLLATGDTNASRELNRLYDLLAEHLPEAEGLRLGIASALTEVGIKVMKPAFDAFPDLEIEFERRLHKYGYTT